MHGFTEVTMFQSLGSNPKSASILKMFHRLRSYPGSVLKMFHSLGSNPASVLKMFQSLGSNPASILKMFHRLLELPRISTEDVSQSVE